MPAATMTTTAPAGDYALDLREVSKVYRGGVHALRGIEMRVLRGEIYGLLGPNGAGKSTLVKILMTVIRATTCQGTMLGQPVGVKPSLRRVGYLPEHHRFPEYLTAAQVLDYFGALSDVPRDDRRRRSGELLDLVGLTDWTDKRVRGFSKGMRQRLGIANALMMDPELVVLDEPTDGVDPVGRRDIRQVLTRLRDQGRTVFLNSHLLSELEMVCDRVAILVQGRVSSEGTIDELTRGSRRYEIEVGLPAGAGPAPDAGLLPEALGGIARFDPLPLAPPVAVGAGPGAAIQRGTLAGADVMIEARAVATPAGPGLSLTVATDDPDAVQPVLDALRRRGLTVRSLRPVRESLEDLFMKAVTDPTTGHAYKPGAAKG